MRQDSPQFPLVVIVDSSDVDRAQTRELLLDSGEVYVAGVVADIAGLSRFLPADPDIVLLDVGTSGLSGRKPGETPIDVPAMVHEVRHMLPRCDLILTVNTGVNFDLSEAMMAGVRGVVPKPVVLDQLLKTVRNVFES